jgi:quinol monooxygenase YgiN
MKFIFEVKMKPGFSIEQYADGWIKASEIMQQTPGALGTYLHRKIGSEDTVLAIAHWQSKQARDRKDDDANEIVRKILALHAKMCDITVIGEFQEPEWQVQPAQ